MCHQWTLLLMMISVTGVHTDCASSYASTFLLPFSYIRILHSIGQWSNLKVKEKVIITLLLSQCSRKWVWWSSFDHVTLIFWSMSHFSYIYVINLVQSNRELLSSSFKFMHSDKSYEHHINWVRITKLITYKENDITSI